MLTLDEVKLWLRLEQGDTAEDALLQRLINTATEYIRNAVHPSTILEGNPIAEQLCLVLVCDWYEHRSSIGSVRAEMLPTVRRFMEQLQNAYPVIETASLPEATVGVSYSARLAADGGAKPYTWSISQGALPDGLALDPATGEISGTPTAEGVASFTVEVTDANVPPKTASRPLTLTVVAAP